MDCPACGAVLREDARVCFACHAFFEPSAGERARAVAAAVEQAQSQDAVSRPAALGNRLEDAYENLEYSTWKVAHWPWEHPWFPWGRMRWLKFEPGYFVGELTAGIVIAAVVVFVAIVAMAVT